MVTIDPVTTTDPAIATASSSTQAKPPSSLSYPSQKRKHDQMMFIAAQRYYKTKTGTATFNAKATESVPKKPETPEEPADVILWLEKNKIQWSNLSEPSELLFSETLDESVLQDLEEAAKEDAERADARPEPVNTTESTTVRTTTTVTAYQETEATVTDPKPPQVETHFSFEFERPTNRSANTTTSQAMLDLQRSYDQLSNEEKQGLFNIITPKTTGQNHNDTSLHVVPNISSLLNANSSFLQSNQTPSIPPFSFSYSAIQNKSSQGNNEQIDPLIEVMSQPRLTVFQALIKELGKIAIAATDALEAKTLAARKLHDPENSATPRSIRQNNFTLTTIQEFRDHKQFKQLQMKVAEHCEQHKQALAAAVKELAMHEITWLKILRVQKIIKPLKAIISSIVFRLEQLIDRPTLPALVKINTLNFFFFYWTLQMNIKQSSDNKNVNSYIEFFGLPFNDIAATAATILIDNSPQATADIIEKLNSPELEWDLTNQQMGRYVTTIVNDLDMILQKAVVSHVEYHKAIKKEKIVEAQTLAFVNKQRVTTATTLTNDTLAAVSNKISTATINEKDMRLRQQELETSMAKTQEILNSLLKEQQKNLRGGSSAQTPPQFKPKATEATAARSQPIPIIKHPKFQPPGPPKTTTAHWATPLLKPAFVPPTAPKAQELQQKNKAFSKKKKHFKRK